MALYSVSQVAMVAKAAGFTGNALVTAVAVSRGENGPGDTGKVNGIGCVGLWQINQKAHPQWTTSQLKDPATNARAAFQISGGGTNWQPWEAYTGPDGKGSDGPWRSHIAAAQRAVGTSTGGVVTAGWPDIGIPGVVPPGLGGLLPSLPGGVDPLNPLGGTVDNLGAAAGSLASISGAIAAGADWLSNKDNWVRILEVLAGAGLLLVGLNIVVRPLVTSAAGTVASALPTGAIAKAVKK